jgi:hypothetical protein
MDAGEQIVVPVLDYLVCAGFSETVATSIVLYALLRQFCLPVEEIASATEECGYGMPLHPALNAIYKNRN